MISEDVRTIIVLVTVVFLVFMAILIAKTARRIDVSIRRVHQQQANIIAMLLRAGFRPARAPLDWIEDGHRTRVMGQLDYTKYDWKNPED